MNTNSARIKRIAGMIQQIYCQILEMIVVDMIFAAYYNLMTDYQKPLTIQWAIGKIFSFIAVAMIFGQYILMFEKSIFRPHSLGAVEHQLVTDGLEKAAVMASFLVRTLNTNFKFKTLLLMGALVTL